MSVRPVQFNEDGSIVVYSDETGHQGTLMLEQIAWAQTQSGEHDHNFLVLECPDGCGKAGSLWPVGGGADPPMGQQMFVNKTAGAGCACGNIAAGNETLADAHVHLNVARMDGDERYQL